jgi:hypothetical protein
MPGPVMAVVAQGSCQCAGRFHLIAVEQSPDGDGKPGQESPAGASPTSTCSMPWKSQSRS